jgi:hypothetical protein
VEKVLQPVLLYADRRLYGIYDDQPDTLYLASLEGESNRYVKQGVAIATEPVLCIRNACLDEQSDKQTIFNVRVQDLKSKRLIRPLTGCTLSNGLYR